MILFKAEDRQMMVNGQTILSTVNAFKLAKQAAVKILADHGLSDVKEREWYPQQAWLDAFKEIAEKMGDVTLLQIGKKIPESAKFPPEINDTHKALAAIDVAYHMNHGKNGVPLFDPRTGTMKEGIGHYKYERSSEKEARVVCDNPYPDAFDRGIIQTMAEKFAKDVTVRIDESKGTRTKGRLSTTYIITWS